MDPLTEALQALRPHGAALHRARFTAPWGFTAPGGGVAYRVVLEGTCELAVDGEPPVRLGPGDLAMLPHGNRSVLRDGPDTPAPPLSALLDRSTLDADGLVRAGGGGAATALVVGKVDLDAPERHPLYESLPPLLVIRASEGADAPWLRSTIDLLTLEATSGQPGAPLVLGHLSGVVFVQAVRAWLGRESGRTGSWAHALADRYVGRALVAVHEAPAAPWTVAGMAREAGLGRSAFSDRFGALVGEPPMTYVTRWRMVEAARQLRGGQAPLAEVAEGVGYASEAAFNRQFKRWMGRPPGAYRESRSPAIGRR